jgi:hypothetical protein
MKTWQEFTIAERREEAEQRMPPLINFDNQKINLRKVYIERAVLGIHRVTDSQLVRICEKGYDAYLLEEMNQPISVGSKRYQQLISISRIDLTSEHIAFHNFRKKLKQPSRMKIAKLMADYYSNHPIKE